jgi:4-amino-4-deoxy-L-arabinose transferase-like glycosyltransferase
MTVSAPPECIGGDAAPALDSKIGADRLRWWSAAALCVLLVAFGVRFHRLGDQSLWEDEIFTAIQASQPVAEMLKWTASDIHPPGYYLLVGGVARLFGWADWIPSPVTDWLWRWLSAMAGTLAVAVTFRLGSGWFGRHVGLSAALLLALSPVAVRYSQEARMHELLLLLAALSTWCLSRTLAGPAERMRWKWWLGYTAATVASLYTLYFGFVVLAAQAGWVALWWLHRRQIGRAQAAPAHFLVSAAAALVIYLPWWPVVVQMVSQRIALHGFETTGAAWSPLVFAQRALSSLGPDQGVGLWLGLALWAVTLIASCRCRPDLAALGGLWLALPVALALIYRDPRAQHMRYAFLLPVYLIFVARGGEVVARRLPARAGRLAASLAILAVLTAASILSLVEVYRPAKTGWRAAAHYLAERTQPGDVIVHDPLFDSGRYLGYYYRGPAEIVTPAVLVASLPTRLPGMRASGGRVWAVTRFEPSLVAAMRPVTFPGLIISEPLVPVYEAEPLTAAMVDLMQQAVAAAPVWAARVTADGIMSPDPAAARAACNLYLGDLLRVTGRLPEAITAYEAMVADAPTASGWATLAEAYQEAGRDQEAVRSYERAVALQPRWQGQPTAAAAALAAAGQWTAAAAEYHAVIFREQGETVND